MREWVSLNGCLMPADEARVSVFDSGFMQGVGLFETMRAYGGKLPLRDRHVARLIESAKALGWSVMPDSDELTENVEQVVNASSEADLRVRLTVTTGSLRAIGDDSPGLTIVATASAGAKYPAECYTKGVTIAVSRYRQSAHDPTIGHKTTSYLARLAALREAHAEQAFEALWLTPDGRPAEGSISSLFVVRNQQLLTPPLNTPVLPGITRAAVMELAVGLGVPVREKELSMPELLSADEAFLTNSLMGVMPVVHVGRDPIGTEQPGETTAELYSAYEGLIERECAHA